MKKWLVEIMKYLKRAKNLTSQKKTMNAIDRLTTKMKRDHERIVKNTIVIRSQIAEISSSFSFDIINALKTWIAMTTKTITSISKSKSIINKDTKIIMRLNDSITRQKLKNQNIQQIEINVNEYIKKRNFVAKCVRAVKKLFNDDIAVHIVDKKKITKFRNNNIWTKIFDSKTKTVMQTYAMMINKMKIEN